MASLACFEALPPEVILKILGNLGFEDLLNVTLINRTFYSLSTDPFLWKSFVPSHHIKPQNLLKILQISRFKRLETVHLCQEESGIEAETIVKIFRAFENAHLKHLTIQHFDLTGLASCFLSRVLNKIENVYINHCVEIRDGQIAKLVKNIPEHGKMKGLQIDEINLSRIDADRLSKSVNSLVHFHLINCDLSKYQQEDIFRKMALGTNLKDVSLIGLEGLEEVSPSILAIALNNLESLYIGHSTLTDQQMMSFFQQLARKSSLKKLHFVLNDLNPHVLDLLPSDIICKGLNKLSTLVIPDIVLSPEQMRNVLVEAARDSSEVRHLELGNEVIPDDVCMEVMKILIKRLEPCTLTDDLREKMIVKNEIIQSLEEKKAKMRLQKKALAIRRMQLLAGSALLRKKGLACKVHVKLVKKSKFSSAFRFASKSRVVKKINVGLKIKIVSK